MTKAIADLILRLLKREERRLIPAAQAAAQGFEHGIRAQKHLALVQEAIRAVTALEAGSQPELIP